MNVTWRNRRDWCLWVPVKSTD